MEITQNTKKDKGDFAHDFRGKDKVSLRKIRNQKTG
jgi:hypothetical protein